jgi:chorismate dehydratase
MTSLRIGAVNYLNTKPLVYGLEELLPNGSVCYDLPSRLADALAREELDIALVPSIELADHPEWRVVSNACIGCQGPVLSVKLLFSTPPAEVRTLALDEGSRTSAVLAQILLNELHQVRPHLTCLPIGDGPQAADTDAVLVIGDRAIQSDESQYVEVWDLGERWCRWSELPMVFAMWVARPSVLVSEAGTALEAARNAGCRHLPEIAQQQAELMNLPVDLVNDYLCKNLYFHLGSEQLQGLELFYQHATNLGLIDTPPRVTVDDCTTKNS